MLHLMYYIILNTKRRQACHSNKEIRQPKHQVHHAHEKGNQNTNYANIDLRCFVARQFLVAVFLRIFYRAKSKKVCWPSTTDKYEVWLMSYETNPLVTEKFSIVAATLYGNADFQYFD